MGSSFCRRGIGIGMSMSVAMSWVFELGAGSRGGVWLTERRGVRQR